MNSLRATLLRVGLAMGLSFALWAFVSFSQNPEELVPFDDLALQVVGLKPGLVIVDANGLPSPTLPSVAVTLRTDRNQRNELRAVDIRTVVDLSGLEAGEHVVPVNVQATRSTISFSVPTDGVTPSAVPVRLEQLISSSVPLDLKIVGNLPFSFERGEPELLRDGDPISQVLISGPQSRVERVVGAQTTANIEQLRASYQAPLALVAVDEAGQAVEGVELEPATVTVRIPITSVVGLRLVPVEANVIGLPAPGFEVVGVQVEPPLISLTGSSGPLDAVEVLRTEPIDIGGAGESLVRTAQIIFPNGTSPRIGQPGSVRVTVILSPLTRAFQVQLPAQVNLVGLGGGLLVTVNPNIVTVALAGSSAALERLSQQTLRADLDVSGLGPGSYQLAATLVLPDGIRLVGDSPIVAVLLRLPPAPPPPTAAPAAPTATPVAPTPTGSPIPASAETPTVEPSVEPSVEPTAAPTAAPGLTPTAVP